MQVIALIAFFVLVCCIAECSQSEEASFLYLPQSVHYENCTSRVFANGKNYCPEGGYNNSNHFAGLMYKNVLVGTAKNSYNRQSLTVGYVLGSGKLLPWIPEKYLKGSLVATLNTGYEMHFAHAMPMAYLTIETQPTENMSFVVAVAPFHTSFGFKFKLGKML